MLDNVDAHAWKISIPQKSEYPETREKREEHGQPTSEANMRQYGCTGSSADHGQTRQTSATASPGELEVYISPREGTGQNKIFTHCDAGGIRYASFIGPRGTERLLQIAWALTNKHRERSSKSLHLTSYFLICRCNS